MLGTNPRTFYRLAISTPKITEGAALIARTLNEMKKQARLSSPSDKHNKSQNGTNACHRLAHQHGRDGADLGGICPEVMESGGNTPVALVVAGGLHHGR